MGIYEIRRTDLMAICQAKNALTFKCEVQYAASNCKGSSSM